MSWGFGPTILGYSDENLCILYERLSVAEQNAFYNEHTTQLMLKHFPALLDAVEFMHSHGVIHQDIRAANIAFRGDIPVFLDFAFASVVPESPLALEHPWLLDQPTRYRGTRETASIRIARLLATKPDAEVQVTPSDDLISLFKLWSLTKGGTDCIIDCEDWRDFADQWSGYKHINDLERKSHQNILKHLRAAFNCAEGSLPMFLKNNPKARQHKMRKTRSIAYEGPVEADPDLLFIEMDEVV